ncbi:MAG: efflux RND transporter periplasmic adaptor subunit [Rubripirellula sp.]
MKIAAIFLSVIVVLGATAATLFPKTDAVATSGPVSTHRIERGELLVTVTEQGTLESSNNTQVKCRVRGDNTITYVIESGTKVETGNLLVQLETLAIEEEISERTKFFHLAESQAARSAADVEKAKLAIQEYEEGRFISELASLEKDLAIARSRLLNAKNRLQHSRMLSRSEYTSDLEVEEKVFAVSQANLTLELTLTNIEVLKKYTKKEEIIRLQGELKAAKATHEADAERALADKQRLERAQKELKACTIIADRPGLVIYPTGEEWKDAPEIEEGATVRKDQTLLLMPDLNQMQVKVGIHESIIDRMRLGMNANVTHNRIPLLGEVTYVASVAKPAGWWTGNVVKYDAIVALPPREGLRPGTSVEVEIVIAQHDNALLVPATAVIETQLGFACWVKGNAEPQRRSVVLGDSSEMFIEVLEGLSEGDEVIIDPLANVAKAQVEVSLSLQAQKESDPYLDL